MVANLFYISIAIHGDKGNISRFYRLEVYQHNITIMKLRFHTISRNRDSKSSTPSKLVAYNRILCKRLWAKIDSIAGTTCLV